MRLLSVQQQSKEWFDARVGCVTASGVKNVMAVLKKASKNGKAGDPSGNYHKYLREKFVERMTGEPAEHYVSKPMDWGNQNEEMACEGYALIERVPISLVGAVRHESIQAFLASPDRLVGDDGLLEVKCPTSGVHLDWLAAGEVPEEHRWQMYAQMACTGRRWCDFMSFDPRVREPRLRVFIKRLKWDDAKIAEMEAGVVQFLDELAAMVAKLEAK